MYIVRAVKKQRTTDGSTATRLETDVGTGSRTSAFVQRHAEECLTFDRREENRGEKHDRRNASCRELAEYGISEPP